VAVMAAAVVTTGCQSAAEQLTESATERALGAATGEDVDLEVGEGRMTVEGEDGSFSVGATTEVPARIAAAAPIPAGFEPASTFEQSEDGRSGVTVTGRLPGADPLAVVDELETAMTDGGWEQVSRSNINDELLSLHLERDEEVFNVNVIADGDETMLTLMLLGSD
jgi:hypothetical protein